MELVFEKAVDEPAFSVAYAQMCHILALKECDDADGNKVPKQAVGIILEMGKLGYLEILNVILF